MTLRSKVVRGGTYLVIRQVLGIGIGLTGVILLTRKIGPSSFGLYGAAYGVYLFLFNIGQWGVNIYLIRKDEAIEEKELNQAATFYLAAGSGAAAGAILLAPVLQSWTRFPGLLPVAAAVFALLPVSLLGVPALAKLERDLDYRSVALIELLGQCAFYAAALPLAFGGAGVWAAVGGLWLKETLGLVLRCRFARFRPRFLYDRSILKRMLSYGFNFSVSSWIWQLRSLVNPLVVGRLLGSEAVGIIDLAARLADYLGVVKTATWRLSIAALARVQKETDRLARAIGEGMRLQALAYGPFLLLAALFGPGLFPALFGPKWKPVTDVFPFIGLSYFANALFSLHCSALYALRLNNPVSLFHGLHVALLTLGAAAFVGSRGIVGYGIAELATLPAYGVLALVFRSIRIRVDYRASLLLLAGFGAALFVRQIGLLGPAILAGTLFLTRREILGDVRRVADQLLDRSRT